MKNISKIISNEIYKFLNGKIIYFLFFIILGLCILGVIAYKELALNVLNNDPKANNYSYELKTTLFNLNGIGFCRLFLTDFIFKNYFSIYAIFIILIAINIFSIDKDTGNMKFAYLTGINFNQIYIGKIISICVISFFILTFNFFVSLFCGQIFFEKSINFNDIFEIILIHYSCILPSIIISNIIALVSLAKVSIKIQTILGLIVVFILGTLDSSTNLKYYSPIGLLSVFSVELPKFNLSFIRCVIISIIYIILLFPFLFIKVNKTDYFE